MTRNTLILRLNQIRLYADNPATTDGEIAGFLYQLANDWTTAPCGDHTAETMEAIDAQAVDAEPIEIEDLLKMVDPVAIHPERYD